jgi:hypothetical protein
VPVEIQEFEVIADVQQPEHSTPAAVAQAAPSPAHIAHEVESTLRKLLARQARLRAT